MVIGLALEIAAFAAAWAASWWLARRLAFLRNPHARHVLVALPLLLLLGLLAGARSVYRSHDPDLTFSRIPDHRPDPGLRRLLDGAAALGFDPIGDPVQADDPASTLLYALLHRDRLAYATVFAADTGDGDIVALDIVTFLAGDRGVLISSTEPWEAVLLPYPGEFRQVFAGEPPAALYRRHAEAVGFLAAQGLPARRLDAAGWERDLRAVEARRRAWFCQAPLSRTAIVLARSAFRLSPHAGPLAAQPTTPGMVRAVSRGR